MKTVILKVTGHEIDDLIKHGQVILNDKVSEDCDNCCEGFEIEIALKVDED